MNKLLNSPPSNSELLLQQQTYNLNSDQMSQPTNIYDQNFPARPQTTAEQLRVIRDQVENDQNRLNSAQQQLNSRRPTSPDSKSSQFNLNNLEQERLFKIRRSFQQALNKLSNNDTKEVGLNECKKIIEQNSDQPSLRVYLSLLCEKHKNSTTSNKELQVLLFGYLAKIYKTDMLDPLDKPPNLLKTVVRVCENIHSFLKENSTLIHLACANSLVDILDNCFISKEDKLTLSLIFYEPLAAVINGGYDKMGQMAASICILKLLEYLVEKKHEAFYDFLCPKFIQLFIKTKCDHSDFLACLHLIIEQSSLKYATQYIWEIVQRCIKIVEKNDTQAYLQKIEACNLLKIIAINLKDVADLIMGYMHRQVIKSLETGQCDRVLKVRQAAIQAKQQWQQVKFINKEIEEKKQNEELRGLSPDELIQARTGYGNIDDVRKQVLEEAQNDLEIKQRPRPQTASQSSNQIRPGSSKKFKMLRELARLNQELRVQKPYSPTAQEKKILAQEQNWSAANRANKFLKRGGGIGGGNIPGASSERKPGTGKIGSHNIQRQSIKDLILDNMKNKNMSPKELEIYMKEEGGLKKLLQQTYDEEMKQFQHNQDPEYQAIADRVQNNRQKLALRQDIGQHPSDTQTFNKNSSTQDLTRSPKFNSQSLSISKSPSKQAFKENDDFDFEEAKVGSGDQSMPSFGNDIPGTQQMQSASGRRVSFQDDMPIPDYSMGTKDFKHNLGQNPPNQFQGQNQSQIPFDNPNIYKRQGTLNQHQNYTNDRGSLISQIQEGPIDLSGIGQVSKKISQADRDSIMNEALGIHSISQQSAKPDKYDSVKQELLTQMKQGKTVAEMDPKEIQRLSEKIIKDALNEDTSSNNISSLSQAVDKSEISQMPPSRQIERQSSTKEGMSLKQHPSFDNINPLGAKNLQQNPKNEHPSYTQKYSSVINDQQTIQDDNDDFFEEQVMTGGDQAFNPFSSQNDVQPQKETKQQTNPAKQTPIQQATENQSSLQHINKSDTVVEIVPQDQSLLKQNGIPTTLELKQVYKPKALESSTQYEQRIDDIQKQIVKEQAPQLIQKVTVPATGQSMDITQRGIGVGLKKEQVVNQLIDKQENILKQKYDIPTKQELKSIYNKHQQETPTQYEQRIQNLQKEIIQEQAPQQFKAIDQQASQISNISETAGSLNKINTAASVAVENYIQQNESILKQTYSIPTKQDLKKVFPKKQDESSQQYETRLSQKQQEILQEQAPQLVDKIISQSHNITQQSEEPSLKAQQQQAVEQFIDQNESLLKQNYKIPTKQDLTYVYPIKPLESNQEYQNRIAQIQYQIAEAQAPQLIQQVAAQQKQDISSNNKQLLNKVSGSLKEQEQQAVVQSFIQQNESYLKQQYDVPTNKELKQIYKAKPNESVNQYEQRIQDLQKKLAEEQAPQLIEQIKSLPQNQRSTDQISFRPGQSTNQFQVQFGTQGPNNNHQQRPLSDVRNKSQLQNYTQQSTQLPYLTNSYTQNQNPSSNLSQNDINSFYDQKLLQQTASQQSFSTQNLHYPFQNPINPMILQQDQDWPLSVIDQLKTVEQFMQVSFSNIESRLKNVSSKIGDTKYNLAKAQRIQQHTQHGQRNKQHSNYYQQQQKVLYQQAVSYNNNGQNYKRL